MAKAKVNKTGKKKSTDTNNQLSSASSAYTVGAVSNTFTTDPSSFDPALAALFSQPSSVPQQQPVQTKSLGVFSDNRTTKVEEVVVKKQPQPYRNFRDGKLSFKEAAAIRVQAKATFAKANSVFKGKVSIDSKNNISSSHTSVTEEVDSVDEDEDKEESEDVEKTEKQLTLAQRNAPKSKDQEHEARTVFVGNLPIDLGKKDLKKMFKKYGEIETIRFRGAAPTKPTALKKVAMNRRELHPDRKSITAFIRFQSRESAEKAVETMNGTCVREHHVTVDFADNRKHDNKKAVFIGNLHHKITEDDVWDYFESCGTICSVRIVRDASTGLGKGFGYINFDETAAVELALRKDGEELKNRPLRISRAVKKEKPAFNANNMKNTRSRETNKVSYASFSGDRLAEIGKLKRKSKKTNRDISKKARIAKHLTGTKEFAMPAPSKFYNPKSSRSFSRKNQNSRMNRKH